MRIVLAVFTFFAIYVVATFVIETTLPIPKIIVRNSNLVSAAAAAVFTFLIVKATARAQPQLLTRIFVSGLIGGALFFVLAITWALAFHPSCNICPIMGIFVAPIGFVLGAFAAWGIWKNKFATTIK